MKKISVILGVCGFLCVGVILMAPYSVSAETVLRSGTDISVAPDQVIDGNFYVGAFDDATTMSGIVNKDMVAFGSTMTVNGEVKEDLTFVSGVAQLHGPVGGDVRIVGGEVTIADTVGGDVVVLGGVLHILPTATIAGDVFFFGGSADIAGTVSGSVYGNAEQFTIDATIGKQVDVKAVASLVLGARANIAGNVTYESVAPLTRDPAAIIGGELSDRPLAPADNPARTMAIPFLVLLFTTLALYLIFRRETEMVAVTSSGAYLLSAFVGLGVIILGPLISMLLMVTVLGSLLGLIGVFVVVLGLLIGMALAPAVAGYMLMQVVSRTVAIPYLVALVLSAAVLYLLLLVPVVGVVVYLSFVIVAIGGLSVTLYRALGTVTPDA
jgi:hypothetical protein